MLRSIFNTVPSLTFRDIIIIHCCSLIILITFNFSPDSTNIYCICKLIYGKLSIVGTRLECDASNFLLLVFVSIKCVVLRTHTDIHKYMKKHVIQSQIIYRSSKFFGGIIIQSISVYFLCFRETENGMK